MEDNMDIIEKAIHLVRPASTRGLAGIWDDEHAIVEAAREVRQSGVGKFDTISPFPLHGIDEAMGLKFSNIPWVTFVMGIAGFTFGLWFTWWVSASSWPLIIGGKPMWSVPAFIPIMFECTILFAALSSVGALLAACGMPAVEPPIIDPTLSSHRFGIFVPETTKGYDAAKLEQIFKKHGAKEVKRAEY
jgi:hypothetical protein